MGGGNTEPKILASRGRGVPPVQQLEPRKDDLTNTITSVAKDNYLAEPVGGGLAIRTANKRGYDIATNGDGIDLAYPQSQTRRGRVGHGVSKTLMGMDSMGTLDNYRIRKLTPRECWRLMGFDDEDFNKAEKVCSNTQLYKQAGNSIVVNVLMGILNNLLGSEHED
jgi:DNA (cytosine-5)-methyltransferase 1